MAVILVRFRCGHVMPIDPDKVESPRCHCGETRVARVSAPAPRFTGAVSGPHAIPGPWGDTPVSLASRPLVLKVKE